MMGEASTVTDTQNKGQRDPSKECLEQVMPSRVAMMFHGSKPLTKHDEHNWVLKARLLVSEKTDLGRFLEEF